MRRLKWRLKHKITVTIRFNGILLYDMTSLFLSLNPIPLSLLHFALDSLFLSLFLIYIFLTKIRSFLCNTENEKERDLSFKTYKFLWKKKLKKELNQHWVKKKSYLWRNTFTLSICITLSSKEWNIVDKNVTYHKIIQYILPIDFYFDFTYTIPKFSLIILVV